MLNLTDIETQFHKPKTESYFLTHSIGLQPITTASYLSKHYLEPWQMGSESIWPKWLNAISDFNLALASLLNSDADLFCPQSNVSSGLTKVIQALPKKENRRVIIATESDFPSAGFVLQQAEKLGFELRLIPKDEDLQSIDVWDKAITDDVHTVFVTKVLYNTNKLIPVKQICELSRLRGATTIIDIAQAAGIVPIDLQTLDADIVVGSCIKWLCGGPGAGFLWLRKDLIEELRPMDVGWFSHQDPFEFDISNFDYHTAAARFWGGTPSVSAYVAATNSIQLISDIGVDTIRNYNRAMTRKIMSVVPEECVNSPIDLAKKGGTLVLKFSNQKTIEKNMRANGILFDSRQYGMRLSPHIYTNENEIDLLLECFKT
jgi:selenocysteine lyase/cysteine desulfurase